MKRDAIVFVGRFARHAMPWLSLLAVSTSLAFALNSALAGDGGTRLFEPAVVAQQRERESFRGTCPIEMESPAWPSKHLRDGAICVPSA